MNNETNTGTKRIARYLEEKGYDPSPVANQIYLNIETRDPFGALDKISELLNEKGINTVTSSRFEIEDDPSSVFVDIVEIIVEKEKVTIQIGFIDDDLDFPMSLE